MATARYYDASKNPEERAFDGVPLRDLTIDEFESLPTWLQASVDAAPFYVAAPDSEHLAELQGVDVPAADLAAALAQPEQVGEADGVEKIAIEAAADGTPAELTTTTTRRRRD